MPMTQNRTKILLTGSSGQLGSDLKGLLEAEGLGVSAFDSRSLDITDKKQVVDAAMKARPGVIINCAAYTKVDLAEKERERAEAVNIGGVENLVNAAEKINAAVIHVSTDFVFDGLKSTPYLESDKANPLGVYGETKFRGEELLRRYPRHIIVRTSWLYGAAGPNFVKTMLRLAADKDVLRVVYDQTGSPTWTKELAGALALAAKGIGDMPAGVYHYSNEGVASWYDFTVAIIEEAERYAGPFKCKEILPILTGGYPTPARRPAYSVMCKDKIKKALPDLKIPHWRVSLRKMLAELYGKAGA